MWLVSIGTYIIKDDNGTQVDQIDLKAVSEYE